MASNDSIDGPPIADPRPLSIKQDYESEEGSALDWTPEEEAKAKRKYVIRIIHQVASKILTSLFLDWILSLCQS